MSNCDELDRHAIVNHKKQTIMKEFMMIFRRGNETPYDPTPEEMQAAYQLWQDWIGGIAAQGKFISTNALSDEGRTVNGTSVVSDGPYAEVKEIVGGYLLCKADSLDEAVKLSEGCPMFEIGGTVEVRAVQVFDM